MQTIPIQSGHISRPVTLMLGRFVPANAPDHIDEVVAKEFGISIAELYTKSKENRIVFPRMLAMVLHSEHGWGNHSIGHHYGDKDPATVTYAKHRYQDMVETWPWFAEKAKAVRARL